MNNRKTNRQNYHAKLHDICSRLKSFRLRRQRKRELLADPGLTATQQDEINSEISALSGLIDALNAARKELMRRRVSPDGRFALNWSSNGMLQIAQLDIEIPIIWLYDNDGAIKNAWFFRDMRGIICENHDGTIATWRMPHTKNGLDSDIIHCLSRDYDDYWFREHRFSQ